MAPSVHTLRKAERLLLVLPASCRSRSGFVDRVTITDLSITGCRIESRSLTVRAGDLVVVRPDGIEGLCGTVRWTDRHAAGIEFATALYPPVVEHLHRSHATFAGRARSRPPGLRRAA